MEMYIYFDHRGSTTISNELWRALLKSAKISQKGRRGLSSRKSRVRKKIIIAELKLSIIRGKNDCKNNSMVD